MAYTVPFHAEVPQTMLTLLHHTTEVHPCQFSLLEALLEEPFPQTPNDLFQLEQRLSAAAAQGATQCSRPWASPTASARPRARRSRYTWCRQRATARRQRCLPVVVSHATCRVWCVSARRPLRRVPVCGMRRWRRPCVSPSPATGPWRANGCGSASTAAVYVYAVPIVGVRRQRGAMGFPHRGVSPG